jgi:act minimal PKS acyl carrier protein
MSMDELRNILVACAGEDADAPHGDISDTSFDDLGYDSLLLIEAIATIKRNHGVDIPDGLFAQARTPQELLTMINDRIGE